jgi:hypothetical protein
LGQTLESQDGPKACARSIAQLMRLGWEGEGAQAGAAGLFSAFRGRYLWITLKVSLMVAGAQGGVYAVQFWMPTGASGDVRMVVWHNPY